MRLMLNRGPSRSVQRNGIVMLMGSVDLWRLPELLSASHASQNSEVSTLKEVPCQDYEAPGDALGMPSDGGL